MFWQRKKQQAEAHIDKPATIRELGAVDISALKPLIEQIPEGVWAMENAKKENNFFCFHHTQHIVFRFIQGNRDHRHSYATPLWQLWQARLLPVMKQAIRPYAYQQPIFPKVMLARLSPGGLIDPHVDGAGSNLHTHKIHIPIQTNDYVRFNIKHQAYMLKEGFAYEVNNIVKHSVENGGEMARIHLIFELFEGGNAVA